MRASTLLAWAPAAPAALAAAALGACAPPYATPEGAPPAPLPEGATLGPVQACGAPVEGLDRYADEGLQRGITEALPTTEATFGMDLPGTGGGLVAVDLDNDGDLDLLAGGYDGRPVIYTNDGAGHFQAKRIETRGTEYAHAILAADLDGDGWPDLIAVGGAFVRTFHNDRAGGFTPWQDLRPDPTVQVYLYQTALAGDLDNDGDVDLALPTMMADGNGAGAFEGVSGEPELILLNEGGELVVGPRLDGASGPVMSQVGALTDRDDDGDLDLLALPDRGPPAAFFRNDGGLAFVDDAVDVGMAVVMAAMGIDHADLNGDGLTDFVASDSGKPRIFLSTPGWGWVDASLAEALPVDDPVDYEGRPTIGWSIELSDLDADGDLELLQASGPEPGSVHRGITELIDLLWTRGEDGGWVDMSAELGFDDPANHIGMVTADFDGDGFLEIVRAGPGKAPVFWQARCGPGAWLEVDLRGPAGDIWAFGAKVDVEAGGRRWTEEVLSLRDKAQGPPRLHFGLGEVDEVELLRVRWLDGTVTELRGFEARRFVTVAHPDHHPPVPGSPPHLGAGALGEGEAELVGSFTHALLETPLEGAVARLEGGAAASVDGQGYFHLAVPEDAEIDVQITGDDLVDVHMRLHTGWQLDPPAGARAHSAAPDELAAAYDEMLGQPFRAETGTLWVGFTEAEGAVVGLDRAHGLPLVVGDLEPLRTDTVPPGGDLMLFADLAPGPVRVVVEPPAGATCVDGGEVQVVAGAITQLWVRCEAP